MSTIHSILARRTQLSIESVLILGIGNTLLCDEGIGVHVVERLRSLLQVHPAIEILDGGTLSFTLAEPIARAEGLIVVDAARMASPPGTVKLFMNADMDHYLRGNRQSVHEVSLTDLLDIARLSGQLPQQRCLVGIEPNNLDWGDGPSPELQPAIEQAVRVITDVLDQWGVQVKRKKEN
jgi:hydrogenase maturation protease